MTDRAGGQRRTVWDEGCFEANYSTDVVGLSALFGWGVAHGGTDRGIWRGSRLDLTNLGIIFMGDRHKFAAEGVQ